MNTSPPLPPAFVARMQTQISDWEALASALQGSAPVSLRRHPCKGKIGHDLAPIPWEPQGLYLPTRPVFTLDPRLHAGAYYVQEASSMFLAQALEQHGPTTPVAALDLCAAPGGKSTHLQSLLPSGSLVVANEVIRSRASILAENVLKWSDPGLVVTTRDPRDWGQLPPLFEVLLVDAPCSGEGLFRKDRAARSEWSERHAQMCAERQRRILTDVWPVLQPGGLLIYSTCTYNPAENLENLAWLQAQTGAESLPLTCDPNWGVEELNSPGLFGYQLAPHHLQGEGFFIGLLRKPGQPVPVRSPRKSPLPLLERKRQGELAAWVGGEGLWLQHGDEVSWVQPGYEALLTQIMAWKVPGLPWGTPVAEQRGKAWVPAHGLALSPHLGTAFAQVALTRTEALTYLRKEEILPDSPETGWVQVTYDGLGLGWIKHQGTRATNAYPKEWRILMPLPDPLPPLF
jgi:16S rRNA C967 or C1407 C5-methylase (RsmB/RsmF family)/NOL1/NOP2/fmu family ribosome biogenesis protein